MKQLTKQTCSRCGGSGKFSFNLVKGTVCFGCNGTGYQMVDATKEAAKKARAAKRNAVEQARREVMISALNSLVSEMNPLYGPFDVSTQLGMQQLDYAVSAALGKSIYMIRNERVTLRRDC